MEVIYLVEKGRVPRTAYDQPVRAIEDEEHVFSEVHVSAKIASVLRDIPRDQVPDMPDRIIAATGLHLSVPILSRDRKIRAANLTTLW